MPFSIDDEYSEDQFIEDQDIDDESEIDHQLDTLDEKNFSLIAPLTTQSKNSNSWAYRNGFAQNETQKEFNIFQIFLHAGTGRSITYLQTLYNLSLAKIKSISEKNNWDQRVADYDRFVLSEKLKNEKGKRQEEHKRKLEEYRQMQELLGRQLTIDAAKIAMLANKTLDSYIENERELDIRDIPGLINSAAKIAEIGKNLSGTALGVDELLTALEEADVDE